MKRPWSEIDAEPLKKSLDKVIVEFPDDDEDSVGTVMIAWNGPQASEMEDIMALGVLFNYLSDSPISLLQKEASNLNR